MKRVASILKKSAICLVIAVLACGLAGTIAPKQAAAACSTALPTDKGTVTQDVTLATGSNYFIWARVLTANVANNGFYMQIVSADGATNLLCSATISGTLTANTWTWIKYATPLTVTTAGTYKMTMAGKDDGVEVDRVIIDGSGCTPNNTAVAITNASGDGLSHNYYGENCAPTDTTAPVVTVTSPGAGNPQLTNSTVTGSVTDASTISNISVYVDGSATAAGTVASPSTGSYSTTISTTGLSVGVHHLIVKATDADGNIGASSSIGFTVPDSTAPVISAISAGSIAQTTATVTWTTDDASDSQVEYGTTTAYGSSTTLNSSSVTAHSVNLTGLTASTTYHYRVKSRNAYTLLTTSVDNTFTTAAPAPDTTPPTVSISTPTTGSTITKTAPLTATASDASSGVAGVQFKLNGNNLGAEITSAPFTLNWNTTGTPNGTYTVTAQARDTAGNTAVSAPITVTINNTAFLREDIDLNGKVDIADFSILASNFNKSGASITNVRADIDGNGVVDIADFSLLAGKFNQ